jgi:hypothetical protein
MPSNKSKIKPKNKKVQPLDFFIETRSTSNTASGIKELFETTHFACVLCKENDVDTKISILDTTLPTFVLLRKHYCLSCWLKLIR